MRIKYYNKILLSVFALLFALMVNAQITTIPIPATSQYSGGAMRIEYAPGGNTVRRPLIVVEGFDAGHILKPEEEFGSATIDGFIFDVNNDIPTPPATTTPLQDLLSGPIQQYDIVYLDYANGTDDIKRNALLVEEVINQVNTMKLNAGSNQPNVILGISMGGALCQICTAGYGKQGPEPPNPPVHKLGQPASGRECTGGLPAAGPPCKRSIHQHCRKHRWRG